MGPIFWLSPNFQVFAWRKPRKRAQKFEKWACFSRKILKHEYLFLPKWPLKMGRGFEARAAHPCPTWTKSEHPSAPGTGGFECKFGITDQQTNKHTPPTHTPHSGTHTPTLHPPIILLDLVVGHSWFCFCFKLCLFLWVAICFGDSIPLPSSSTRGKRRVGLLDLKRYKFANHT